MRFLGSDPLGLADGVERMVMLALHRRVVHFKNDAAGVK